MLSLFIGRGLIKRYRLSYSTLATLGVSLASVVLLIVYAISLQNFDFAPSRCPLRGPGSSAPINDFEFLHALDDGLSFLRRKSENELRRPFDGNVVSTCINSEAAIYNWRPFLRSLEATVPSLVPSLLVFCVDMQACQICRISLPREQCIYMNLRVASSSLAPGSTASNNKDYWRLTYGRVFATVSMVRLGINALPADVDAIFLQNPFQKGNGIYERPNDIAVVSDIAPFTFKYGDKTPINGGYIYFPGRDVESYALSRELVDRVWAQNCHPEKNEQLVTSSALRYLARKYKHKYKQSSHKDGKLRKAFSQHLMHDHKNMLGVKSLPESAAIHSSSIEDSGSSDSGGGGRKGSTDVLIEAGARDGFGAHMLSVEQYLNFCSTDCGVGTMEFASIRSIEDLHQLEHSTYANPFITAGTSTTANRTAGSATKAVQFHKTCGLEARKKWVYFHTACLNKYNISATDVAKVKAVVQKAVYAWAKGHE
mmetsp:Transcript_9002/g.14965  ORF Transcript_9002/g.14965 Transcript_9002/m.14965 type:complete len:483 (+) Transcript_9002:73-1521(+)